MNTANVTTAADFVSEVLGPALIADNGDWGTFAWNELLLSTPALRLLGGTDEIMKNILAERVLGSPAKRRRRVDRVTIDDYRKRCRA
jgi:acyl-CoA dehydrogenase